MTNESDEIKVARLARVAAALSDPFQDADAVLRGAGLTADMWLAEHEMLAAVLGNSEHLRAVFERAFALARGAQSARDSSSSLPESTKLLPDPRPSNAEAVPTHLPTYLLADQAMSTEQAEMTLPPTSASPRSLPFRDGPPAVFVGEVRPTSGGADGRDDAGATLPLVSAPGSDTLPFALPAYIVLLKLERYAELAAELRARPASADEIMTRYGLVQAEDRERLHGAWQMRFESNPKLREQFELLVARRMRK